MRTNRTLLVTVVATGMMLSAAVASAASQSLTITNLQGTVRIAQDLPCDQTVQVDTTIQSGHLDLAYQIQREGVLLDFARLDVFITPFSVEGNCDGVGASVNFREIGLKLASAVIFPGEPVGGLEDRLYRFRIPKEQFLLFESVLDDSGAPQPKTLYKRPSEDVTGLIDLGRNKSVQLHVVLTDEVQFKAGCERNRCLIDETHTGTTTSDVLAAVIPGPTPPIVSCTPTAPPGSTFNVFASDETAVVIKLGTFTLANEETFQLQETGQPGVRLVETSRTGVRHFQVGPGEAFVTATDTEGNVAIAFCK
jgi:hypothetical protein